MQEVPGSNPGGPTKYLKDLQTVEPSEVAFWSPTGVQFARLRARPAIRERHVAALPIGVGSRESQAVFLRENEEFTREYPRLHDLSTRIFIRGLPLPDEQEVERLRMLPEDDPTAIKFEDKISAERIIFFLGRIGKLSGSTPKWREKTCLLQALLQRPVTPTN